MGVEQIQNLEEKVKRLESYIRNLIPSCDNCLHSDERCNDCYNADSWQHKNRIEVKE